MNEQEKIMGLLNNFINKAVNTAARQTGDKLAREAGNKIAGVINSAIGGAFSSNSSQNGTAATGNTETSQTNAAVEAEFNEGRKPNTVPKLTNPHNGPFNKAAGAIGSSIDDHGSAAYFVDIISKNIPGATCTTNVSLESIGARLPYKKVDIDVLVSVGGVAKLAIFLPPKSKYKNACYVFSMNSCEAKGVKAIRFMKEFTNEADYSIGRIKSLL